MENDVSETADHERIWRGSPLRTSWRSVNAMDRGIPGEFLPAHGEYVEENFFFARHVSLDPDGFPLPTPAAAGHSGLLQPQGIGLRPGREEEGVLRNAEILSRAARNVTEVKEQC